jgi:arginyl-tRNA synthetase
VLSAVRRAVAEDELRVDVPEKVVVRRPPRPGCGDYATNVALQLARSAGCSAYEVAAVLAPRLAREPGIAQVEVAGAGFLNITLSARAYADVVRQVREQGAEYGSGDGLAGEAVTVVPRPYGAVRATLVAEVVNRLMRYVGAGEGGRREDLSVAEPDPGPALVAAHGAGPGLAAAPAPYAEAAPEVEAHGAPALPPRVTPVPGQEPPPPGVGLAPGQEPPPPHVTPVPGQEPPPPGVGLAPGQEPPPPRVGLAPGQEPPALGPDEMRWALLRPPGEDGPKLTRGLLDQRESNPLFRVRYAHARTRAALRNALDLGVDVAGGGGGDPYRHPAETELLGLIADYPRVVETAARRRAPDRLARHLERLADAYFRFQDECPALPKGDEKPSAAHAARVRLADATGIVLAGGLALLGISAPDHL